MYPLAHTSVPWWYRDTESTPRQFLGGADGEVFLALQTYRCIIPVTPGAAWMALQWEQATGGAGAIASHEIRHTLEPFHERGGPDPLLLGRNDIWAPTPYLFVTPGTAVVNLPDGAGTPDSIILPIIDPVGAYLSVRFVVGAADCTRVRFLAQGPG